MNSAQRLELQLPFAINEHGFVPMFGSEGGGNPYIQKNAIQRRLDKAAPNWQMSEPRLISIHEDTVIMTAALRIDDQEQWGVGTGIIQRIRYDKDKKPYEIKPYDLSKEVAKAFKTAASDCFPRAAVLYGIGWYLRPIPASWKGKVNTPDGLTNYLDIVREIIVKAQGDAERAKEILTSEHTRRLK